MDTMSPPDYEWKLVYEDGSEFTNLDGAPWESPALGALFVLQPGRHEDFLRGKWGLLYRRDAARWIPVDEFGLLDQAMRHAWEGIVFRPGVTMPNRAEFKEIWQPYLEEVRGRKGEGPSG